MKWPRLFRRKKSGWESFSHTITVPPGAWKINQEVTVKKGKLKTLAPTLIDLNFYEPKDK